ncbi:phospholipase D family protein [Actinocatenispora sera]|uniref:phospholipase D family protein n=1 Tax=Actinocatenispora sera TaxID=390989 RepID=UPI0033C64C2B
MLPPDARMLLTEQLRPPVGLRLDHAVATTFTLDLPSALLVPLAFAGHRLRETEDPVEVLHAVRSCADRIDVFCQAGQLKVPAQAPALAAFLESVVHQVRRPRPGHLFHPKLWLVRYVDDDGEFTYRLLVLTRNLTADRSWDLCVRLDGVPGSRRPVAFRPLTALLQALPGWCVTAMPDDRARRVTELAEQCRQVEWELPTDVDGLRFHALGVAGGGRPDFAGTRQLVVSPFCTPDGLDVVAPAGGQEAYVVARQDELDRLPAEVADEFESFVLDEMAGVPDEESQAGAGVLTGLHAKMYVVEYAQRARVLIGSANATRAAFAGNVEFLVELAGTKWKLGIDTMLGEGVPLSQILQPYERMSVEAPDEDLVLDSALVDLASVAFTAEVAADGNKYRLRVTTADELPSVPAGLRASIGLLTRPGESRPIRPGEPLDCHFDGLTITELTPFLILTVRGDRGQQRRTTVRARLLGDPDGRLDEILAEQIATPDRFLKFLLLLLGFGESGALPSLAATGAGGAWSGTGSGLFELMVNALADRPDALDDLRRLVRRLLGTERGRAVLPDGFEELWDAVQAAHEALSEEVPA